MYASVWDYASPRGLSHVKITGCRKTSPVPFFRFRLAACRIVVLLLALFWLCLPALAGDGQIVVAPANSFGIRGVMNFSVNYRYVPTPEDVTRLRQAIESASDIICDATDGQIVFGTVTITAGTVNEDRADVWVFPQNGRSSVSFFFNGSGFGNLGSHINLFQGGVNGGVLAHELGHLAFGLGDEYNEQCRFGGPCGIGQAFETGTIDGQNNTLMQQSGIDQTEFTVAANHDPTRGNGAACATNNCGGTAMDCSTCQGFNNTSNRFESSQHTLIHGGESEWQTLADNYPALGLVIPALPVAAQPANCRAFLSIVETVGASNLVCLVMDRSGSMTIEDAGDTTRMEFAKAAARAFVDVSSALTTNYQVGLVSFNQAATVDQPVQLLTSTYAATLKASIDNLSAAGNTAIGDGLLTGAFELIGKTGTNPTLFLLSDGANNAGTDPEAVIGVLRSRNIRTFTIPVGNGADRPLLSDIAGTTGGRMLDAAEGNTLPPIYMELAVLHSGSTLVLPRTPFAVAAQEIIILKPGGTGPAPPQLPKTQQYPVTVETNAKSLIVFLSNRNQVVRKWYPSFSIKGPDGTVVTPFTQPSYIGFDTYYQIIRVPNPAPGTWTIEVSSASFLDTYGHILAFVENPEPDLYVDANPKVASPADTVTISAAASFVADLDAGVEYIGYVTRPDSSTAPLTFTRDPLTRKVSAVFNSYNGRGIYTATVQATAFNTAKVLTGEIVFAGPEDPGIIVQPFSRTATAAFFLDTPAFPPEDDPDFDHDGIPDRVEEAVTPDPDQDGIPNDRDEDSDNDDIPDSEEQLKDDNHNNVPDFVEPSTPVTCPVGQAGIQILQDSVQRPACGQPTGSIFLTVTGGSGTYTYKWSHNDTLNQAFASNLPDGLYSVVVTDSLGCRASAVFDLVADCSENVVVQNNCLAEVVEGCKWEFRLKVDVSKAAAADSLLGSFTGKLTWNPQQLVLTDSASLLNNFTGLINVDSAAGTLTFNGVNTQGLAGVVDILSAGFAVKAKAGEQLSLKVDIPVMAAARTFTDLRPNMLVEVCEPIVAKGLGVLGDVNDDDAVNSTDALVVLSYDAGLPIPQPIQTRIDRRVGDVNSDQATNSTDALIILTHELNPPTPYPIGIPFCPDEGDLDTRLAQAAKARGATVAVSALAAAADQDETLLEVPVLVEMGPTGEALGSFTTVIRWNPESLELLSYKGGQSAGFGQPVVNAEKASAGMLTVANANAVGSPGTVNIFTLQFRKRRSLQDQDLKVDFKSMAAAGSLRNLTPHIKTHVSLTDQNLDNNLTIAPNPFNQSTTVYYQVKAATQVEISVYNSAGVKVATLVKDKVKAGNHAFNWDTSANHLPAGMYILKMQAGIFNRVRKVIVIK